MTTFPVSEYIDTAGSPRVETYPSFTIAEIKDQALAGGASITVKHGTTAVPGVATGFIVASRPLLTWNIRVSTAANAVLVIATIADYLETGVVWRAFPLFANIVNECSGLIIPSWKCEITIYNTSATVGIDSIVGFLRLQGVS